MMIARIIERDCSLEGRRSFKTKRPTTVNTAEAAVADALVRYERALNTSDVDAALDLYAPDGVFMPQNSPSSAGVDEVRKAYELVFRTITLRVQFSVTEVHQLAPDWAFARTNSTGTSTAHATGVTNSEGNQELFIFQRIGGDWKIARYCFSTTLPPH
jgi:uncharacterized protein (TIGR02246 family)